MSCLIDTYINKLNCVVEEPITITCPCDGSNYPPTGVGVWVELGNNFCCEYNDYVELDIPNPCCSLPTIYLQLNSNCCEIPGGIPVIQLLESCCEGEEQLECINPLYTSEVRNSLDEVITCLTVGEEYYMYVTFVGGQGFETIKTSFNGEEITSTSDTTITFGPYVEAGDIISIKILDIYTYNGEDRTTCMGRSIVNFISMCKLPPCISPTMTYSLKNEKDEEISCVEIGGEYYVHVTLTGGSGFDNIEVSTQGEIINTLSDTTVVFGPFPSPGGFPSSNFMTMQPSWTGLEGSCAGMNDIYFVYECEPTCIFEVVTKVVDKAGTEITACIPDGADYYLELLLTNSNISDPFFTVIATEEYASPLPPTTVVEDTPETFGPFSSGSFVHFNIKNPGGEDCEKDIDVQRPNICMKPFITTWKTDNLGTSNSTSIRIPLFLGETYDFEVSWKNGGVWESFNTDISPIHDYGVAGTYTVAIRGVFPRIYFNEEKDVEKLLSIEQWGGIVWTSMNFSFLGCSNMVCNAIDAPNLSNVTNLTSMFQRCANFNSDIGFWDVSNVTNMGGVFAHATSFNQDISGWDFSNVTEMGTMFYGATSFDQDIGDWNVSNVTNMLAMFYNAGLSTPNYDALLTGWASRPVQPNVTFYAGSSKYTLSSVAAAAKKILIEAPNNWDIVDGGSI